MYFLKLEACELVLGSGGAGRVTVEAGVLGVRRVDKKDIKRIAKVTGAQVRPSVVGHVEM